MRVFLDDAELPGPIPTLSEAIDQARETAGGRGRVIVEAHADGDPIADEWLEHPGSVSTQPALVRFVSADPRAMVGLAMLDAADLLQKARDDHAAVVAAIDAAEVETARRHLDQVLGAWSACIATVRDGGRLINLDTASPTASGPSPDQRVATLSTTLGEVKRCLNAQDWAGLSDVVGEDLDRQSREWDQMLRALAAPLGA